jgi:hypothetical protein
MYMSGAALWEFLISSKFRHTDQIILQIQVPDNLIYDKVSVGISLKPLSQIAARQHSPNIVLHPSRMVDYSSAHKYVHEWRSTLGILNLDT